MLERLIENAQQLKQKLAQDNMYRSVAIQEKIETDLKEASYLDRLYNKDNNLNLPSLADLLNVKSDNPVMNWKGIFPAKPQHKIGVDPKALQNVRESKDRSSRFLGMLMQASPVLGQMFGGMSVGAVTKRKDPWYSPTNQFLAQKLPGTAPAGQLSSTLNSWVGKGLIKREEVE